MPADSTIDTARIGSSCLPVIGEVDGRTKSALAFKQAVADFVSDLGGEDAISRAELELVRRSAGITVLAAQHEASIIAGKPVDVEHYCKLISSLNRTLGSIGLKRRARDVTPTGLRARMGLNR